MRGVAGNHRADLGKLRLNSGFWRPDSGICPLESGFPGEMSSCSGVPSCSDADLRRADPVTGPPRVPARPDETSPMGGRWPTLPLGGQSSEACPVVWQLIGGRLEDKLSYIASVVTRPVYCAARCRCVSCSHVRRMSFTGPVSWYCPADCYLCLGPDSRARQRLDELMCGSEESIARIAQVILGDPVLLAGGDFDVTSCPATVTEADGPPEEEDSKAKPTRSMKKRARQRKAKS
jgi:hypothetical protein